jgi:hypothetical protein
MGQIARERLMVSLDSAYRSNADVPTPVMLCLHFDQVLAN